MTTYTNVDVYFDDYARTAGEVFDLQDATLTLRTDTRVHANAPAGMTGYVSNLTVNVDYSGEYIFDARNVRWLAFTGGAGNVPAIGTTITGVTSGATGYLLGIWADLTSAPTAPGAATPATGFIKFREVSRSFSALETISGSAWTGTTNGVDKTGWIEVVCLQTATITGGQQGKFTSRGDWFYLDDTTGVVGQVLQVPTNGGGSTTYVPGVWIETSPGSNEYEFWPSLNTTLGWAVGHLSQGYHHTDRRQSFVKLLTNGQMQISEDVNIAATYATTTVANTYTWAADVVTVTSSGHGLFVGERVYLNFTTGGATAFDGIYTIVSIPTTSTFTVALSGSGASGAVTRTNRMTITHTAHPFFIGQEVYLDITTGSGVSGLYTILTTPTTATFTVEGVATGATSGNVTEKLTIGRIPEAGCKTRIPNIFIRQCTAAAPTVNAAPHATLASRPDFSTTYLFQIDIEYLYGDWDISLSQPSMAILKHCAIFDRISLSELNCVFEVDDCNVGLYQGAVVPIIINTTPFGGTFKNCKSIRGDQAAVSSYMFALQYATNVTVENCEFGCVYYTRLSYSGIFYSNNITFRNCRVINGANIQLYGSSNCNIYDLDGVDRYIGRTNTLNSSSFITTTINTHDILIDGITVGYNGLISNVHPIAYPVLLGGHYERMRVRHIGTIDNYFSGGTLTGHAWNCQYAIYASAWGIDCHISRCYTTNLRVNTFLGVNSNDNHTFDNLVGDDALLIPIASSDSKFRGCRGAVNVVGQAATMGTFFNDQFTSDTTGAVVTAFNSPSMKYAPLMWLSNGARAAGTYAILMHNTGAECIVEMPYFAIGHTGFQNVAPTLTGNNTEQIAYEYQIDTGSGWNGIWKTLNGDNLSAETISPVTGFKLKYKLVATTNTYKYIMFITVPTTTTLADQQANLYPLDPVDIIANVYSTETRLPVSGVRVLIQSGENGSTILNDTTDIYGIVSGIHDYTSDFNISGRARYADSGIIYNTYEFSDEITSAGLNLELWITPES